MSKIRDEIKLSLESVRDAITNTVGHLLSVRSHVENAIAKESLDDFNLRKFFSGISQSIEDLEVSLVILEDEIGDN
jgi:hypothetical protein